MVEGAVEKDSATVIVPLSVCPVTGETNETTGLGAGVAVADGVAVCLRFETLTSSEAVCSSWLEDEYALAERVCVPFATAVESHT